MYQRPQDGNHYLNISLFLVDRPRNEASVFLLLSVFPGTLPKVQYLHLRGKALNILPEHSPEAQQCLSQAIKHDPSLVDAWNALGECYWKAGNVQQAYDCFAGALMHVRGFMTCHVIVSSKLICHMHTVQE